MSRWRETAKLTKLASPHFSQEVSAVMERPKSRNANHQPRRRWTAFVGAVAFSAGVSIVPFGWAFEDAKLAGLRGILPEVAPTSLNEDAFAILDGNWQEWSEKTASEVAKLYSEDLATVSTQREQLGLLKQKLDLMEKCFRDVRYSSIHESLGSLYSALNRRVALAEAVLDTLTIDPHRAVTERLDVARKDLSDAVKNLESDLKSVKNGPAWLTYVRASEILQVASEKKSHSDALPVINAVQTKLSQTNDMAPEIRQFLEGERFVALRKSLDSFVKVAAELDRPVDDAKLRAELTNLVTAVEGFEENFSTADAEAVRKAFESVRREAPDGAQRIAQAMSTHYFNYNLRVVLSERFLTRLSGETQTNKGPVDDWILGAKVDGNQVTNATIGVDLKPSNNGVRFNITLQGVSQSSTQGVTNEATVQTNGYHRFSAWKPIVYDGDKFVTSPADIRVNAHNQTVGISTAYSGGLFGGIADSIAAREVESRRGQAEAIAAQKLSSRLLPEFNKEVNAKFTELNQQIDADVNARLKKKELFPSATSYRSTEDEMRASLRLMDDGELGGGDGPFAAIPAQGFVVALHESLLNNSLDRLKFAGRTMTDTEVAKEIETSFEELLGRSFQAKKKIEEAAEGSKEPATFIFPEKDPIRLHANNGQLTLVIRAGLKQKSGEEDIPTQEISVPLSFHIDGTQLVIESGQIGVSPVEPPKSAGLQIARAGVVRTKIKNALPTRKFDRAIAIGKETRKVPVNVGLAKFQAAGGWIVLSFE